MGEQWKGDFQTDGVFRFEDGFKVCLDSQFRLVIKQSVLFNLSNFKLCLACIQFCINVE
jgi:hypothetical protein